MKLQPTCSYLASESFRRAETRGLSVFTLLKVLKGVVEPISWAMVFLPCSEAIVQLRNFLAALMFSESAYLFKHSYCVATGRQSLLLLVGQTHVDG